MIRDAVVLHGYSLADMDDLAVRVVRNNRAWWPAGDREDLHASAWEGIAECLCESPHPPARRDLMEAGRQALARDVRDHLRHHGARNDGTNNGAAFARYWAWHSASPSPEVMITDQMALSQILPALPGRQQQAVAALAASGDYHRAAALLGIEPQTFRSLIGRARAEFRRLWHEGETPSGHYAQDRRAVRHETSDPVRLAANARYAAQVRERRRAAA